LCLKNNKIYFGESGDVPGRLDSHWRALNNKNHDCSMLQEDWDNFGQESFIFLSLDIGPEWALRENREAKEKQLVMANSERVYNRINRSRNNQVLYTSIIYKTC
jgi:hypothetical protein